MWIYLQGAYTYKKDLEKMESNFCRHCAKWKLEYVKLKSKSKGKILVICKDCFTSKIENSLIKCHNYEIIQDIRI
jgi:RNase P subunit RPR2